MNVRGLNWQVALLGIACGVLGVLVTSTFVRITTRGVISGSLGPTLTWLMQHAELERCERAPETWSLEAPHRGHVFSYDAASLRSLNPRAPELDAATRASLVSDLPGTPRTILFALGKGGITIVRAKQRGPCALAVLFWNATVTRAKTLWALLICGVITGVFSVLVSFWGMARPMARRLATVGSAARRVGGPSYAPVLAERRDDFGELARELDRAHARIRADGVELERRRKELQEHIAEVAHDIRTPLSSLQLALQDAASHRHPPAELKALLARALEDVVYVGGLIGNLRLASELRERWDPPPRTRVVLGDTVERAVLRLRFLAEQKGVTLEYSLPDEAVCAEGDPIAIEQALANVLENAVVHGSSGGKVAALLERDAHGFRITVLDDGPGVAPADLPRLFERHFRAHASQSPDARGRGLGLAITHEVCRRLGFTLAFAREQPSGLRVTVAGPCSAE
jgi:signal transduction histidine kinase